MILAYIDPGAGSLLVQGLIAALISVPFFFRRTIGDAWRRVRGEGNAAAPSPAADDEQHGSAPR